MIRCIRWKNELAVVQQVRATVVKHSVGFGKEIQKAIVNAERSRYVTRILRAAATPAIQCVTIGVHSTNVAHAGRHRDLLRTERSDQRVIDIDVNDAFTFQVQSIRIERQFLSVGERRASPGRRGRLSKTGNA